MKLITALLITTFSISSWAYVIINPSQVIYELAPVSKEQPDTLNIYAFCPKSWDRYGASAYQHCKTYELNTTSANLKNYVLQVNQQGLSQEEALDLWHGGEKLQKKSENSLAIMFVGALAGPAVPAIAFFKGLFNSISSDNRKDKVIQMSHPFTLLMMSNDLEKKRMWINDDTNFEKYLMESINSFYQKSTTEPLFNQRLLDIKTKEIEKQKQIEERRKAQENMGGG
jgi:exonuclease VII small subunit